MSEHSHIRVVELPGFPPPKGYAHGMLSTGRVLHVAGQVGWNERGELVSADFVEQLAQALANVAAVVRAAGGVPEHVVSMTVYVTDLGAYSAGGARLKQAWGRHFGRHYPAMALVGVAGLVEPGALCEVQAVATLPSSRGPREQEDQQ